MALAACSLGVFSSAQTNYDFSKLQREKLGRGVVAVRENTQKSSRFMEDIFLPTQWKPHSMFTGTEKRLHKFQLEQELFIQTIIQETRKWSIR